MFLKRVAFLSLLFLASAGTCHAQKETDPLLSDTTILDYDEIFSELDQLLDSINKPRSFSLANVTVGSNYFSYVNKEGTTATSKRQFTYSPSVGFFGKSGLGLSAGASLVNDGTSFAPYQYSVTGSYDFMKVKTVLTGISLTRFFTRKDLPFYTSPLQNELYAYFTMRKLWFKPSVAASYGWGSRESYEQRETVIKGLLLSRRGYTQINTTENLMDFSVMASVRHDFYFLKPFSQHDYFRITPQLAFTGGTQQFGFNQTANTYTTRLVTGRSVLHNTQNSSLDNNLVFQPLSLTGFLKTEYARGKFFLQPQLICDYYFPASEKNFSTTFLISAGYLF